MNTMKHISKAIHLCHHPKETNLALGLLFWILVVAGETFRRIPLHVGLAFWAVVPPLLFPIWVQYWNVWDLFLWAKTITLIPVVVIWGSLIRMGMDNDWTRIGTFIVLSINIAEAIAKDFLSLQGRVTWNRLNALSGILVILSEVPTLHTIRISDDRMRDILWALGPSWIIAYTIWNLMFVYSNYPYAFGRHVAVLLAPTALICRSGWNTWLQARAFTLAFYFMIRCTVYERMRSTTDVHLHQTVEQTRILQLTSFACVVILLAINNIHSYITCGQGLEKGQ